jgi:HK97 family phage major capsid protein
MEITDVKTAIETLGKEVAELRVKNDERWEQIQKKGYADPLLEAQVKKLSERVVDMTDTKERLEKVETKINRPALGGDDKKSGRVSERKAAFLNYVRKGESRLSDFEVKLLSVDSDPQGGYWVEEDMSSEIITKIFETSPMREIAAIETISSDALEIPEDINEADAGWVSERGARSETAAPKIGMRRIAVHELYAEPKATQQLLDDAKVNVEAWLSGKIADKIARTENLAFITGTGVGQPKGILSYATSLTPTNPGQVQQVNSGNANLITDDGLRKLFYSVKSPYIQNAKWLMRRSTVQAVSLLKDSQGRYVWEPGLQMGDPQNLLGMPIVRMEDMPAVSAGNLAVAFGDFNKAYTIVDRMGIRMLRDPFTAKPFVLFYATKRTGGDVTNFEAYSVLKISA